MNFQQIRDFVNPAVAQATGLQEVDNLQMPVPTAHLMQAGGGGSITVDSELSETSTNPVENRVITAALRNSAGIIVTYDIQSKTLNMQYSEMATLINQGDILKLKAIYDESEGQTFNCAGFTDVFADPELPPVRKIVFYSMQFDFRSSKLIYSIIMVDENNEINRTMREVAITQPL